MVKRLGYKVLIAQCGKEALDILSTHSNDIDLVLLDLALPDMPGQELYPLLKDIRSDLKVIVCSGYSIDGTAHSLLEQGAHGFLQKPFRLAELAALLKKHIDRRRYKRFKLNQEATARPHNTSADQFRIIDISVGGLAFCYKEKKKECDRNPERSIDICLDSFNLGNIPFKTISNAPVKEKSAHNNEWAGRCSIQFVDLSPNHINQLDSFIKNRTRL
jgi:DNA-binding response OmpR family regulator